MLLEGETSGGHFALSIADAAGVAQAIRLLMLLLEERRRVGGRFALSITTGRGDVARAIASLNTRG